MQRESEGFWGGDGEDFGEFVSCSLLEGTGAEMSSDIRKWFIKQHNQGNGASTKTSASQKSSQNVREDYSACFLAGINDEHNFQQSLRIDYLSLLLKQLTDPLRVMAKDAAMQNVVEFMNTYSLSQEDLETIMELSKFKGHPNPMDGIPPAVKAALTKAYKQASTTRIVRTADLINLPGVKKAPKKRIAAILEPVENSLAEENDDTLLENEDGSDAEEADDSIDQNGEATPQLDLKFDNRKGIQVQLDLKNEDGMSNSKSTSASKARGSASSDKGGGRGGWAGGKRKR